MKSGGTCVDGGGSRLEGVQVLVVDDEGAVRRAFAGLLGSRGAKVVEASDAMAALDALRQFEFDVVLVDIQMPGANGLTVLRSIREHHLDVACIIVTGQPDVETAIDALRLGAFDYLDKADAVGTLRSVVARAAAITRLARVKREAQAVAGRPATEPGDLLGLDVALTRTLASLWMAYQPIVRRDGTLFGYEALMRSDDRALPHPAAILEAAERLGRLPDVGRRTRTLVGSDLANLDDGLSCFLNLHPSDLADLALLGDLSVLADHGQRVVLEVTEREPLEGLPDPRASVAALRAQGCRIAVDDLGAGYAGLTAFARLEPEIVKLDMSLVRDVDRDGRKAHILRRIIALCHDLGTLVVAEGVETVAELEALVELDCDLFQGFLIAEPAAGFPDATWPASIPEGVRAS